MSLLQQKKYKLKKKQNNNNNLKKPLYLLLTRGIIIVAICDVDLVVALLSSCRVSRRGRETIKRYDVTETYSHVVRQNLQKRKLRVLNPARIHVFYWFNWLNLIGS